MKIKKISVLLIAGLIALSILHSKPLFSQVELTPFVGYMMNGKTTFIEGQLKLSDNISYGVILGIPVRHGVIAELSYTRSESRASWNPYFGYGYYYPETEFGVNINFFQVGAIKELEINDNVDGFGGLTLGAGYYNTTEQHIQDLWRFVFGLKAGIKYFFSESIGIRLQGRMLFPLYGGGAGVYCGVGSGGSSCGLSVGGTALILQGDLSAGIIFRFKSR